MNQRSVRRYGPDKKKPAAERRPVRIADRSA
jgi:hypothetical protein